jgi:hypothetical protein
MQKTAQKRSLLNKLREMTNVSGIAAEKLFNPEFEELMNRLRNETDDPVRAIVTGEKIGEADAPDDGTSLKALLASAKSNVNRREYMKSVADLGRFHKKMYDVVRILSGFKGNVDKVHEQFLFKDLDDDSKQHLHDLKSRFSAKSASSQSYFIKQANILDFFANIGTERGRALGAWEKKYPKQIGKLKKDTASLLGQSEKLLTGVISTLKEMASARSVRNPDKYILASTKIIKAYDAYDKIFKDYYESNVKGFLEKQQLITPPKVEVKAPGDLGSKEVGKPEPSPESLAPTLPAPPRGGPDTEKSPPPEHVESNLPIPLVTQKNTLMSPTSLPLPPRVPVISDTEPPSGSSTMPPSAAPDTTPSPPPSMSAGPGKMSPDEMRQLEMMHGVASRHESFYKSLSKMSKESPILVASYINKYASSIQSSDPTVALKLFQVARSIER